jgi:hypothetical protein
LEQSSSSNPGWGAYLTPETLKRYNSKWPEVNIFFILNLFLTKYIKITVYLDKGFNNKKFSQFFNQNVRASTCLWWCFCAVQLAGSHL